MSEEHLVALSKHCRVCGSYFRNKKGRKYSCSNRKDALLEVFGIDDVDAIHPRSYCHPCNNIIYKTLKQKRDEKDKVATWFEHNANCSVCDTTHSVGGKQVYAPGRPAKGFQPSSTLNQ